MKTEKHVHDWKYVRLVRVTPIEGSEKAVYVELWKCHCGATMTTRKVEYL